MHLLLLIAALGLQSPADTTPAPRDAAVRVTFEFPSGAAAPIAARSFELGFANAPVAAAPSPATLPTPSIANAAVSQAVVGTAQARFVKDVGPLTPELAHYAARGDRIPVARVEVLAADGTVLLRARLSDVTVSSAKIVVAPVDPALEQQRLSLGESIAQLSMDLQEARRAFTVADALDQRRLSASQEVQRARERVTLLETRVSAQRSRLALLDRQLSAQSPIREEITLTFGRYDLETGQAP